MRDDDKTILSLFSTVRQPDRSKKILMMKCILNPSFRIRLRTFLTHQMRLRAQLFCQKQTYRDT